MRICSCRSESFKGHFQPDLRKARVSAFSCRWRRDYFTVALSLSAMKYQIVIQWPASSNADYDRLVELEYALIDALSEGSEVDGHDAGSGEMNIFVHTESVQAAFAEIKKLLAERAALNSARVAYREIGKNEYTVLWPEHLERFSLA